jgi:hypothetical protein
LLLDGPASGRVMNLDEARRAQRRMELVIGAVLLAGCWILALIYAILGSVDGMIGCSLAASSSCLRPISASGYRSR